MPGSAHGSDDTEGPILRDFVNGNIGDDPRRTPSPRSELLSPTSNRAGAVEIRLPRQASSRYRRTRELALRNVPDKELLGRLINQEYQSRQLSKALRQSFERIQAEASRADEAVRAFNDATQHIRTINEAKIIAHQEASRAKEDLRLYKFQLDNAQREILRAQDVVKMLEEQRDAAEIAAAKARTTARRMNEERLVANAREEGRRLGFEAGFRRAQEGLRNRDPDARRRYQADLDLMGIDYTPEDRYLTRRGEYKDQSQDVDQLQDDDSDDASSIHTYTPPRHSPNVIRLPDEIRSPDDNRLPSDIRDVDPIYIPEPITLPISAPASAPLAAPPHIDRPPSVKTPAVEVFQLDIPSADNLISLGIRPSTRRNTRQQDTRQPRAPSRQSQTQARSRSRSRDVPPDNYIPSSFEGNIPIPPPHQMSQPPPPLEDDDNYRSDARSRGPDAAGPSRPRDHPRRRSIDSGSASTRLSSFAIVSAPSSNAPATRPRDGGPRRMELSMIPEDLNSRQTSPVVSRRSREGSRPVSSMDERPPAVPLKDGGSAYDDALSVGGGSNITTREHQRRWDSQRNREAMQRAADPYDRAAEDWTRHQTPEARPPRIRPAHLTTPAPLASSTPRRSVAHQRSRTMSANYQSSPRSSQFRNSQDDINIRVEPPSQTPTDTLGHNSFAENQNQMLSPRASPAPSRHGTPLVPTVPNTPTMPSAPLQWPQDGQLPPNFIPDSTYSLSATQYQQERPPSRPHSHVPSCPSSSMGHPVPVPPPQNYAPSRPASVRSIASRRKSLNTPASANTGLPGDKAQPIRRVPSNASIASGGSYASFDPNTYLDPAYLTTPETRANTYANAGPTHSRSRSRANSNASQLSYLTNRTH